MARSAGSGVLVLDDRRNRAMFTNDPPVAVWPIDSRRQNGRHSTGSHVVVHERIDACAPQQGHVPDNREVCPDFPSRKGSAWSNA